MINSFSGGRSKTSVRHFEKSEFFDTNLEDIPDWQLRLCVNYEYARESEKMKEAVSKLREKPLRKMYASGACWRLADVFAHNVPEFPKTPWRDILSLRRDEIQSHLGILRPALDGLRDWGPPETYMGEFLLGRTMGILDFCTAFVVEIDFREHDEYIRKKFAQWLSETRTNLQELHPLDPGAYQPTKNRKGRANNYSRYRSELGILGRYRKTLANRSDFSDPSSKSRNQKHVRDRIAKMDAKYYFAGYIL